MSSRNEVFIKNFEIPRASYHLMLPAIDAFQNAQRILLGDDGVVLTKFFWVFEGVDLTGGYLVKKELRTLIEAVLEKIQQEPERVEKIHTEAYALNDAYFTIASDILEEDVTALDDVALVARLKKLFDIQVRSHQHALTTTWFVDSDGEDFSKLLLKKTEEYVSASKKHISFAQAFTLLTTAPKSTFMQEEELDMLHILLRIRNDRDVHRAFLDLETYDHLPESLPQNIRDLIDAHVTKWRWFPFAYLGPAYDHSHYIETIVTRLREAEDSDAAMMAIAGRPKNIEDQRKELFAALGVSRADRRLYDLGAEIAHLKGYRKECMYHGFYALDTLLREVARRTHLSFEQIHMTPYHDLINALEEGSDIDADAINERKKETVISYEYGKPFRILTLKKAQAFLAAQKVEEQVVDTTAKEFQGTCACSGKAEGMVRIVNTPEDMSKMRHGDIMVAHTTYPSLVPAMKKAAAIVTEDGGVTCHAAIVSREFGTPCITGIKVATKVFKDGDRVHVDASNGMVKKLPNGA